ncbi:hypothetical protein T484DRAFT_2591227 [Baffinella frigidus]|nr:hypothetical protein T484DRAFT_2591227 [Cryptophyta sp. CCMP2293]
MGVSSGHGGGIWTLHSTTIAYSRSNVNVLVSGIKNTRGIHLHSRTLVQRKICEIVKCKSLIPGRCGLGQIPPLSNSTRTSCLPGSSLREKTRRGNQSRGQTPPELHDCPDLSCERNSDVDIRAVARWPPFELQPNSMRAWILPASANETGIERRDAPPPCLTPLMEAASHTVVGHAMFMEVLPLLRYSWRCLPCQLACQRIPPCVSLRVSGT